MRPYKGPKGKDRTDEDIGPYVVANIVGADIIRPPGPPHKVALSLVGRGFLDAPPEKNHAPSWVG